MLIERNCAVLRIELARRCIGRIDIHTDSVQALLTNQTRHAPVVEQQFRVFVAPPLRRSTQVLHHIQNGACGVRLQIHTTIPSNSAIKTAEPKAPVAEIFALEVRSDAVYPELARTPSTSTNLCHGLNIAFFSLP